MPTIDAGDEAAFFTVTVKQISYHGWQESLLLSNGTVEAIVVPAIGRVMQFRFAGEASGAFWENRELDGCLPGATTPNDGWLNFGGDKTWPAPQSEWEDHTGRAWPPPHAFDSRPFRSTVAGEGIMLVSDLDPGYGVRAVRLIRLVGPCPQLEITTEFHKEAGATVNVGVWVVTQLSEPERIFVLLPEHAEFPGGYHQQRGPTPRDFQRNGRLLSLKRDPHEYIKIGTEGTSLLWMDQELVLLIHTAESRHVHRNDGCRTEVYTNPDPHRYVELETSGPPVTLKVGARIARTNTYTLFRRSTSDCIREAHRVFEL